MSHTTKQHEDFFWYIKTSLILQLIYYIDECIHRFWR